MKKVKENENLVKNSNQPQNEVEIDGIVYTISSKKELKKFMKLYFELDMLDYFFGPNPIGGHFDKIYERFNDESDSIFPFMSNEEVIEYFIYEFETKLFDKLYEFQEQQIQKIKDKLNKNFDIQS